MGSPFKTELLIHCISEMTRYSWAIDDTLRHFRSVAGPRAPLREFPRRVAFGARCGNTTACMKCAEQDPSITVIVFSNQQRRDLRRLYPNAAMEGMESIQRKRYRDDRTYLFDGVPVILDERASIPMHLVQVGPYNPQAMDRLVQLYMLAEDWEIVDD